MDVCLQYSPLWGGLPHPNGPTPSSPPVGHRPLLQALPFSLPGPTPAPPPMYLAALWPCRWASAATLLRTVLRLARTCWGGGDDQHWKRGDRFPLLASRWKGEEWAPTWAKGVTIMSSPCLWGERTLERVARELSSAVPSNSVCPHYALS